MNYLTPTGQEYAEYMPFPRYKAPCTIVWVCLQVSDKQLRWYDLSVLREVVSPFDSGLLYDQPQPAPLVYGCELPPRAIVPYVAKVLYVTPELLNGIDEDKSSGVEIRLIA